MTPDAVERAIAAPPESRLSFARLKPGSADDPDQVKGIRVILQALFTAWVLNVPLLMDA